MKGLIYILMVIFISIPILLFALENENKIKINNIKFVGNERISSQVIGFYIKLEPGSYVDDDNLDSVIKVLYKTKLFASVNAYIDDEKNLIIKVQENPLIKKITLKGNRIFKSKELLNNVIQSKPLTIFAETKLQSDLLNLAATYRNSGKIGARIGYDLSKLEGNRVSLVFKIKEGKTSRIRDIRFIGNKNFSESELERVVKMQNDDVFNKLFRAFFKGKNHYSPQYLLTNEELLDRFYSSNGYIKNNIQPIVEIGNNNQVILTFLIDEGEQYLFGNNEVSIKAKIQDLNLKEEILGLITREDNKVFDRVKVNSVVEKINKCLNERGYIFAKVNPEYTQRDNIVDVTYKILPGKRIYVNQITIDGNDHTLDQVIRSKLSIVEGDAYNTLEIQKSYRKLISSDFFEEVKIDSYVINDNAVNLDLNVREKNTTLLYLGGGVSFPGGAFLKADFKDRNLFGSGKELSFALEKSQYVFSTDLEVIENNFNDSDTTLGVGIFYEKQDRLNTTFNSCNMGFFTKVSHKVTENLTNFLRYYYKYSYTHTDNKGGKNSDISKMMWDREGEHHISSLGYTLAYSKLDNLYAPREGYLLSLSQDISGLGGNVNFLKSEFLSFYVHPILSNINNDTILRFKMAAGHIFSYTSKNLNISQHFFKGSNEIRGFDLSGIGPRTKDKNESLGGKTYFNLTQQVDFPLLKLYDYFIVKGSLFVDYATLFGLDDKSKKYGYEKDYYDSKLVRVSPGFGFSAPSPFGGRFRLDFGFPLVKEPYDITPSSNIKFSIETGV
ncbi:outer membrane protein assembly factor BamA [Wolbachia endosymbiont of Dirofilaria (Dirofilaria) immitis]|uniref:outer membrane protein assembly factor BamA n=1 Tax=Wolbachia endosymbiont of Dirofilaria (Dirofilaria) immitis TaxID=1812115 RepID=UPI00158F045B|nr:outer membrane protein assembly factor BamA [Wolbachia endosymbiont of Dirofilaria (Dirofilaria) immitis]QKX02565.1 outer membrane protein assembly factor BamA [Wolbachia endosymbiont of Dirofilaria (Dirofilaria) immitis]